MLKKIMNKIVGTDQRKVILDSYLYNNTTSGYTGGSLENSNCLIVANYNDNDVFADYFLCEKAIVKCLKVEEEFSVRSIEESSDELLGTYEHVVNCFKVDASDSVEQLKSIYHTLQTEADYLVNLREGLVSTLTLVVFVETNHKNEVIEAVENLLKGLSEVLGRHGIITNGIIVSSDVDIMTAAKWASLLSSKYGHILAGEVVHLASGIEG
ncbi:MAG: hypothetical protein IJ419_16100 [Agathobacter sp.]|nr:hypothetical protein [Agathobacter sp.]